MPLQQVEAPGDRVAAPGHGSRGAPLVAAGSLPCTSAGFAQLSAEILQSGKALRFQAHGASMVPLVRDGDVLLVQPLEPAALRIGDVILCGTEPGRIVVHRVIRCVAGPEGRRFTVQGDAVARPDGTIPAAQAYGRVAAIERGGAQIDMGAPAMRLLSRMAALRSRWRLGRGRPSRLAAHLLRKLPAFSKHLA